jgi:GT2 family glycosyltransferase
VSISVVIPTMNKLEQLRLTLAALLLPDADIDTPWEVVVVDDGSVDGTAEFLRDLVAGHRSSSPALHVVAPGVNLGRARARNLGARNASGNWILFLDDDIVIPPGLVGAHYKLLKNNPGCGTIGYAITEPSLVDGPHFHYLDSRGTARLGPGPAPARFFVTQNAAVPREEFLSVGGFDEAFSAYGFEDMEVAFRLEDLAGIRFFAVPEPVPRHVHHHTLTEYLEKKVECGRHSLIRMAEKHPRRMKEMRLHFALDPIGLKSRSPLVWAFRFFADSGIGRRFPGWMSGWSTTEGSTPRCSRLYFQAMNLAVLCCYRHGATENTK